MPSVDVSKGPLADFVGLVEVIGCLNHVHLTPEKAFSSQAQKCFLLRNRGAAILGIQREETAIPTELIWDMLFATTSGNLRRAELKRRPGPSPPVRRMVKRAGAGPARNPAPPRTGSVTLDNLLNFNGFISKNEDNNRTLEGNFEDELKCEYSWQMVDICFFSV